VAKRAETRAMRHTLGSVQKQGVKYGATAPTVTVVDGKASIADPSGATGTPSAPQSNAAASGPAASAATATAPSSDGSASGGSTTQSGS
ncbi:MAG: hypothetical protein ACYDCL_22765, partial [Myxococcales bacterium]